MAQPIRELRRDPLPSRNPLAIARRKSAGGSYFLLQVDGYLSPVLWIADCANACEISDKGYAAVTQPSGGWFLKFADTPQPHPNFATILRDELDAAASRGRAIESTQVGLGSQFGEVGPPGLVAPSVSGECVGFHIAR